MLDFKKVEENDNHCFYRTQKWPPNDRHFATPIQFHSGQSALPIALFHQVKQSVQVRHNRDDAEEQHVVAEEEVPKQCHDDDKYCGVSSNQFIQTTSPFNRLLRVSLYQNSTTPRMKALPAIASRSGPYPCPTRNN